MTPPALLAGDAFDDRLLRSSQQADRMVQLHFNSESLELPISYDTTFEKLIETACEYWHISPLRHVVTDQNGVHLLRRTLVFEALAISAQSTSCKLFLIALHQERSASQKGTVGAAAAAEEDAQDDARDAKNLEHEVDKMLRVRMLIASDCL